MDCMHWNYQSQVAASWASSWTKLRTYERHASERNGQREWISWLAEWLWNHTLICVVGSGDSSVLTTDVMRLLIRAEVPATKVE